MNWELDEPLPPGWVAKWDLLTDECHIYPRLQNESYTNWHIPNWDCWCHPKPGKQARTVMHNNVKRNEA